MQCACQTVPNLVLIMRHISCFRSKSQFPWGQLAGMGAQAGNGQCPHQESTHTSHTHKHEEHPLGVVTYTCCHWQRMAIILREKRRDENKHMNHKSLIHPIAPINVVTIKLTDTNKRCNPIYYPRGTIKDCASVTFWNGKVKRGHEEKTSIKNDLTFKTGLPIPPCCLEVWSQWGHWLLWQHHNVWCKSHGH